MAIPRRVPWVPCRWFLVVRNPTPTDGIDAFPALSDSKKNNKKRWRKLECAQNLNSGMCFLLRAIGCVRYLSQTDPNYSVCRFNAAPSRLTVLSWWRYQTFQQLRSNSAMQRISHRAISGHLIDFCLAWNVREWSNCDMSSEESLPSPRTWAHPQ